MTTMSWSEQINDQLEHTNVDLTERLTFIRLNQTKQRLKDYIHLRDGISTEEDATNVGGLAALPAMYTDTPRHMHEYTHKCKMLWHIFVITVGQIFSLFLRVVRHR